MIHRGEIIKKEVESSGIPISRFAEKLKMNRMTLYSRFRQKEMDLELIKKIGKIISFDFSTYFKELPPSASVPDSLPDNVKDLKNIIHQKNSEISQLKDEMYQLSQRLIKCMADKIKSMEGSKND